MANPDDDERCCGTGTCLIDAQGHCWCGQQWDGTQMCRPQPQQPSQLNENTLATVPQKAP